MSKAITKSASDFLSGPVYKIMYDPNVDKVVHVAKFSKASDDILMTNTSNAKDGMIYFLDQQEAETMAENLTKGKPKAYYPFIVSELDAKQKKRLLKKSKEVIIVPRQTKYGMGNEVIPLIPNIELNQL